MLQPKKKFTKQEIERDPVLEKTILMEKFIRTHAQTLLIAFGVVALVVIVGVFMMKSGKTKKLNASGKLGLAQMAYQNGDLDDAVLRLEEVLEDFSGLSSAGAACLQLGQIYMEKEEYETAKKYYSEYVNKYDDAIGKAGALDALGVCFENTGNFEEAAENYKKAVKAAEFKFQKQISQVNLARISMNLGDLAGARKLLDEVKNNEPEYNLNMQVELLSGKLVVLEN
ncbi:MAG: tetratricopeptide repeat protein [Candidatus Marinimicrobia bacterium]|nr:tetratricopeptide repeat protein [Candidatus Neomarinimicrobiota bacterium]